MRIGECNVSSLCVCGSLCFVCCVFVNCVVKQFAICLGSVCYFVVECDGVVECGWR